jgi:hypothetical protein
MHDDWHLDRVVSAIRWAAEVPGDSAVADALAAAIANQEARERVVARKRKQEEAEAARRQEEEAVVSGLEVDLRAFRGTDPGMTLLTAVEYITSDPARRLSLYRRCCADDQSICGMVKTTPGLRRSLHPSQKISPCLSAARRPKGFRFRRGIRP